jgi:hypothetical protein
VLLRAGFVLGHKRSTGRQPGARRAGGPRSPRTRLPPRAALVPKHKSGPEQHSLRCPLQLHRCSTAHRSKSPQQPHPPPDRHSRRSRTAAPRQPVGGKEPQPGAQRSISGSAPTARDPSARVCGGQAFRFRTWAGVVRVHVLDCLVMRFSRGWVVGGAGTERASACDRPDAAGCTRRLRRRGPLRQL